MGADSSPTEADPDLDRALAHAIRRLIADAVEAAEAEAATESVT